MDTTRREFDIAWAYFQSLQSLRLADDTLESEWTRGRDTYLAFLVVVEDAAAVAHLRELVRRIEGIPGVEPYPEEYWHATIKGVGFEVESPSQADEVAASDVASLARAAREVFAGQPPFDIQIGLAGGFAEVVIAEVWNAMPVRELNRRLLDAIPGLLRYPFDGTFFLPHVSIARFTSREGLSALKEAIAGLREEPPGPGFSVGEVHLIRARLSEHAPSFETIETYTLR